MDMANKSTDKHVVSEEDKRIVTEMIAVMPASVSTNLSTGEVIKMYKDGRVVKSTIPPTVTKIGDDTWGTGKIEFKINLDL
jgi:hypothetical protein